MPGFMQSGTISMEVRLSRLRVLGATNPTYALEDIPRKGFNTLWGHIQADETFRVNISHEGIGGTEGPTERILSAPDPITTLQVVKIEGIHFLGEHWNILIDNPGLNMSQIDYYLEMKP